MYFSSFSSSDTAWYINNSSLSYSDNVPDVLKLFLIFKGDYSETETMGYAANWILLSPWATAEGSHFSDRKDYLDKLQRKLDGFDSYCKTIALPIFWHAIEPKHG